MFIQLLGAKPRGSPESWLIYEGTSFDTSIVVPSGYTKFDIVIIAPGGLGNEGENPGEYGGGGGAGGYIRAVDVPVSAGETLVMETLSQLHRLRISSSGNTIAAERPGSFLASPLGVPGGVTFKSTFFNSYIAQESTGQAGGDATIAPTYTNFQGRGGSFWTIDGLQPGGSFTNGDTYGGGAGGRLNGASAWSPGSGFYRVTLKE